MKIAAIILNYNSAADTEKCIEFLQKQKLNEELHVIVVDNSLPDYRLQITDYTQLSTTEKQSHLCQSVEQCSKQGLERAYQKKEKREYRQAGLDYAKHSEKNQKDLCNLWEKKQIEFIRAEENRGYSAGNNIGLRRAVELGCEYVLVVNPDMEIVDPYYIEKLVAVMQADEDVVVAATDIVTPEGIHQNPMLPDGNWRTSFGWVTSLLRPQKRAEAYDFIGDYAVSGYCAKVSGCCLMLRCSFLQEIGYFDEYPFLYCEE
ncbi:MAG: glycosyltransferase family 2 protein, partial [Paludibacteraceae bacterium]|nr:glycosyltransferase family 2 protein [Paludibacteraceae bacterium]